MSGGSAFDSMGRYDERAALEHDRAQLAKNEQRDERDELLAALIALRQAVENGSPFGEGSAQYFRQLGAAISIADAAIGKAGGFIPGPITIPEELDRR